MRLLLILLWTTDMVVSSRIHTARDRFHLQQLVQIHHIYPRQFRNHPVLRHYDIHDESNLIWMPTKLGSQQLHTRPDRLVHDGGHASYNRYVGKYLEHVKQMPPSIRPVLLNQTQAVLRNEMRRHTFVPWD